MKRLNSAFSVAAIAAGLLAVGRVDAQDTKPAAAAAQSPSGTAATDQASPKDASKPDDAAAADAAAPKTTAATSQPTTPPAATATAGASATTAASAQALDGSTYVVRLRDLEQRIDELKEQIRRSHTRLSLLSDTILSGGVGGARAEIVFKNDLSNAFKLTGVVFVLDGVVQYNRQDDSEAGLLDSRKEIPIFSGSIPPGDHTLQVIVRLRGHGYGVFSYLRGYKFDLKSSHSFTITEGKTITLETIAWEKGDVTTPLEQRPAIRYEANVRTGTVAAGRPSPASSSKSPVQGNATQSGGSVSGGVSIGTGAK